MKVAAITVVVAIPALLLGPVLFSPADIGVERLAYPELLVEIEGTAVA
jgi:hypothetical protein